MKVVFFRNGQSMLEISLLLMVVALALAVMMQFIKRSIGGKVKATVSQLPGTPYTDGANYHIIVSDTVSNIRTITVKEEGGNPNNKVMYDNTVSNRDVYEFTQVTAQI